MSVVVTFSGLSRRFATTRSIRTGSRRPWPPEFLEVLDWQWEKKAIPYWTEAATICRRPRREGRARGAPRLSRLQRRDGAATARGGGRRAVGVNFDPSHFFWQGVDMPAAIRALGDAIFHVHAKDVAFDRRTSRSTACIDAKSYRRMAERSWLFRSVGWGHDELEWKRIVSALRLAGYDDVAQHRARGRAGVGGRRAARRRSIC